MPLFVEELTKTVLEVGPARDAGDRYELAGPLPPLAIPATLQDSLMARLDRLAPVKEVAQIGAVIGREFSHELLAAVADRPRGASCGAPSTSWSTPSWSSAAATPPDATYSFKHALVQDAAYASLLQSRRQQLHARIAEVLEERFPELAAASPRSLAHHCTEAGLPEQAVDYWHEAGQRAIERSAYAEALGHLTARSGAAPMTCRTSPSGPCRSWTCGSRSAAALMATRGYVAPETMDAYSKAARLG